MYFFKYANETSEEDLERIIGSDLIIKRAYEELNRFNWSEKEYIAYEQEIKRIKDEYAVLLNKLDIAKNEGIQIGHEKGRQEGIKIGEERGKIEGIAEGGKQAKIEVAKNLLEDNVPIDVISRTTGLPIDKIKDLHHRSNFTSDFNYEERGMKNRKFLRFV